MNLWESAIIGFIGGIIGSIITLILNRKKFNKS
jgi:uncharacterized membrane-anchored protein YhcB (DUF1043 family)